MAQVSAEQQARDLLERLQIDGAQYFTAGDLVELANVISDANQWRKRHPRHDASRACTGAGLSGPVRVHNGQREVQCRGCNAWLATDDGVTPEHGESASWYPGCDDGGYR